MNTEERDDESVLYRYFSERNKAAGNYSQLKTDSTVYQVL